MGFSMEKYLLLTTVLIATIPVMATSQSSFQPTNYTLNCSKNVFDPETKTSTGRCATNDLAIEYTSRCGPEKIGRKTFQFIFDIISSGIELPTNTIFDKIPLAENPITPDWIDRPVFLVRNGICQYAKFSPRDSSWIGRDVYDPNAPTSHRILTELPKPLLDPWLDQADAQGNIFGYHCSVVNWIRVQSCGENAVFSLAIYDNPHRRLKAVEFQRLIELYTSSP